MAETENNVAEETTVGSMLTADTPTKDRTIGSKDGPKYTVQVPTPFSAGPVTLTAGQAAVLNQTLAENVSNNLRAKLIVNQVDAEGNDTGKPHTDKTAQSMVDEYVSNYKFGGTRGSGGTRITDPVEREARKLARAAATDYVKGKGLKVKDVDMTPIIEQIFTANKDTLMAKGKQIVAAATKAQDGLEIGNIDVAAKAE